MSALIKKLLQQKRAELEDATLLVRSLEEDIRNIVAQLPISKSEKMIKKLHQAGLSNKTNGKVHDISDEGISMNNGEINDKDRTLAKQMTDLEAAGSVSSACDKTAGQLDNDEINHKDRTLAKQKTGRDAAGSVSSECDKTARQFDDDDTNENDNSLGEQQNVPDVTRQILPAYDKGAIHSDDDVINENENALGEQEIVPDAARQILPAYEEGAIHSDDDIINENENALGEQEIVPDAARQILPAYEEGAIHRDDGDINANDNSLEEQENVPDAARQILPAYDERVRRRDNHFTPEEDRQLLKIFLDVYRSSGKFWSKNNKLENRTWTSCRKRVMLLLQRLNICSLLERQFNEREVIEVKQFVKDKNYQGTRMSQSINRLYSP